MRGRSSQCKGRGQLVPRFLPLLAVLVAVGGVFRTSLATDKKPHYSKKWFLSMRARADMYERIMGIAYNLDGALKEALANELDLRIQDQHAYMQNASSKVEEISGIKLGQSNDDTSTLALAEAFQVLAQEMPMNPDRVADWLEQYVPPETAAHGRVVFHELLYLHLRHAQLKTEDPEHRVAVGVALRRARWEKMVVGTPESEWLPAGMKVSSQSGRSMSGDLYDGPRNSGFNEIGASEFASGVSSNLPWLPIFSTWRAAAAKISFQSRRINPVALAQLWSGLTLRAWRRIALDPDTFNEIQSMTSNKQVAKLLKDRGMQDDLDALFLEFKMRLKAIEAKCKSP